MKTFNFAQLGIEELTEQEMTAIQGGTDSCSGSSLLNLSASAHLSVGSSCSNTLSVGASVKTSASVGGISLLSCSC